MLCAEKERERERAQEEKYGMRQRNLHTCGDMWMSSDVEKNQKERKNEQEDAQQQQKQ